MTDSESQVEKSVKSYCHPCGWFTINPEPVAGYYRDLLEKTTDPKWRMITAGEAVMALSQGVISFNFGRVDCPHLLYTDTVVYHHGEMGAVILDNPVRTEDFRVARMPSEDWQYVYFGHRERGFGQGAVDANEKDTKRSINLSGGREIVRMYLGFNSIDFAGPSNTEPFGELGDQTEQVSSGCILFAPFARAMLGTGPADHINALEKKVARVILKTPQYSVLSHEPIPLVFEKEEPWGTRQIKPLLIIRPHQPQLEGEYGHTYFIRR